MRRISATAVLPLTILCAGAANAADPVRFPTKPIRFISPYGPGGGNDTMARLLGQRLTENLGQQVIVDNRPGGNTMIGTDIVAKSRPDGHTILFSGLNTFIVNALLVQTPYDIVRDFTPIAAVAGSETILVVNPALPAANLQELIALAKARPGELNYATSSAGGGGHLVGELFKMTAGINIQHIPYKGSGQALTDVVGGQIQISILSPVSTVPHIKAGRLRGLAISGDARFPALPQVPTFAEGGMPGVDAKVVYGVLAAARTPPEIAAKLAAEIARIQRTPEFRDKLATQSVDPLIMGPAELAAFIRADMVKYARIVKAANMKLD